MPSALVLGVNGQDGSYLAETLLQRGYTVWGIARQANSRYVKKDNHFNYSQLDIAQPTALIALLHEVRPDVIFHSAAIHGSAGFKYEPVFAEMTAVNLVAVHTILEFARLHQPHLRLVYANSSKIFPAPLAGTISEATAFAASCMYSIGKIASLELIRYYREHHGIAAANLILFNHESPRRLPNYFIPILARGIVDALANQAHTIKVRTLDFFADWSSAKELMEIAVDISEKAPSEDFVMASGTTWHARTAVDQLFSEHGLDYRDHVKEELPQRDPGVTFKVSVDHLEQRIARRPMISLQAITDELIVAITRT